MNAGEIFGRHLQGIADDNALELTHADRKRIFNLGYYTWVEQRNVSIEDFERRRHPAFWRELRASFSAWDRLIGQFNAEVTETIQDLYALAPGTFVGRGERPRLGLEPRGRRTLVFVTYPRRR